MIEPLLISADDRPLEATVYRPDENISVLQHFHHAMTPLACWTPPEARGLPSGGTAPLDAAAVPPFTPRVFVRVLRVTFTP